MDMTPLRAGGENGGAKIFIVELLWSFQKNPDYRFLLLTAPWNHEELAILEGPNMSRRSAVKGEITGRVSPVVRLIGHLWDKLGHMTGTACWFPHPVFSSTGMLKAHGVHLLFCPFTAPTYQETGIPTISVLYDLQHVVFPQFLDAAEIGVRNNFTKELAERADHIVCISEYMRQAVLAHLKTRPEKTHTVYIGIHSRLSAPDPKTDEEACTSLGIAQRPYMFYPANFWPHKNHRMLLTVYGMFLSRHPESPLDLVFTGALPELENDIKAAVERMGLAERVHFLGFLPQAQLEVVLSRCEFLIFPSLYEGFGIPVLEAMSMGKPVICSNTASLPEIAGDAALYFDPRKPGDILNCLERVAADSGVREILSRKGRSHAQGFSFDIMKGAYEDIFALTLQEVYPPVQAKIPPAKGGA